MGISARIVKRIITLLIVILGVVTLSFCLQIFTGTDPAEMLVRKTTLFATEEQIQAMRVELGLDGTLSEQYADYIKGLLTGDLGISITNRKPVIDNIRNALPVTCMLVIMSMLWVAILTVLISAFSVIWKDKAFDHTHSIWFPNFYYTTRTRWGNRTAEYSHTPVSQAPIPPDVLFGKLPRRLCHQL